MRKFIGTYKNNYTSNLFELKRSILFDKNADDDMFNNVYPNPQFVDVLDRVFIHGKGDTLNQEQLRFLGGYEPTLKDIDFSSNGFINYMDTCIQDYYSFKETKGDENTIEDVDYNADDENRIFEAFDKYLGTLAYVYGNVGFDGVSNSGNKSLQVINADSVMDQLANALETLDVKWEDCDLSSIIPDIKQVCTTAVCSKL